jgi:hypothetical protein
MRVIPAAIAAIALLIPAARADWEYTKWGMTPEQVAAASKGEVKVVPVPQRYKDEDNHWEIAAQGTHIDGALRLDVGFAFDTQSGRLKCVLYNALGDQATPLKDVLVKRYGPPQSDENFAGTAMLKWSKPDAIELALAKNPVAAAVTHCAH